MSKLGSLQWTVAIDKVLKIPRDNNTRSIHPHVDDLVILVGTSRIETAVARLGVEFLKVQRWAEERGLKMSNEKTQTLSLKDRRKSYELPLMGKTIRPAGLATYLGVMYDYRSPFFGNLLVVEDEMVSLLSRLRNMMYAGWDALVLIYFPNSVNVLYNKLGPPGYDYL